MQSAKNSHAAKIMDSSIKDDLYLAFIDQQIDEVRNMVGVLREAIIQMVMDEADTKKQSDSLLSLLKEMICLKAIKKDLCDSLGSNSAVALPTIPLALQFKPARLPAARSALLSRARRHAAVRVR
jgi:hypothetical protein